MARKVAMFIAGALGASPDGRNPAEPAVHVQASRTRLAAVHASASVTKKSMQESSDMAERKALHEIGIGFEKALREQKAAHHQNRSTIEQRHNATKGSMHQNASANATKPNWRAKEAYVSALKEKAPMAKPRITKRDPMNSAGVHAYPMVRSKSKVKTAVTYSVDRRDAPHVVIAGQGQNSAAEQCECAFEGICEPQAAMTFMSCLQNSCSDTNNCQCEEHQYINACHQLSNACKGTKLQLTCLADRTEAVMLKAATGVAEKEKAAKKAKDSQKAASKEKEPAAKKVPEVKAAEKVEVKKTRVVEHKTVRWSSTPAPAQAVPKHKATTATTTEDPIVALYAQLEQQKEELCGLSLSHEAGFLNAAAHKDLLQRDIDANMQELEARCKELPEMHCEKDFHEYSAPGEECGVEVDNEFTRNAFKGGKRGDKQGAAEKSSCNVAVPGFLSVAALVATLQ